VEKVRTGKFLKKRAIGGNAPEEEGRKKKNRNNRGKGSKGAIVYRSSGKEMSRCTLW